MGHSTHDWFGNEKLTMRSVRWKVGAENLCQVFLKMGKVRLKFTLEAMVDS